MIYAAKLHSFLLVKGDPSAAASAVDLLPREHRSLMKQRAVSKWLRRNKRLVIGALIVGFVILLTIVGPFVYHHDPFHIDLPSRKQAPFQNGLLKYPLGTDGLGRDILSRLLYGARISLTVGLVATAMAAMLGTTLGMTAGFVGGRVENVIMRVTDLIMCYPFVITSLIAATLMNPGLQTILIVFVMFGWTGYARVIHGVTLSLKAEEFVEASRALGSTRRRLIFRHLLPNALSTVVVMATLQVRLMILGEATLSFLGIGIQPPTPSWGVMISTGREYLSTAWWISTVPGFALMVLILGFNILGDGLNDFLNPRL